MRKLVACGRRALLAVGTWVLLAPIGSTRGWAQGLPEGGAEPPFSAAREAPSLWESSDLRFPKGKRAPLPEFGEALTQAIRSGYLFLGDFEERDEASLPEDWVDARSHPLPALLLGSPSGFERPLVAVEFPMFRLTSRVRFSGTDDFTFLVNSAVSHWAAGEDQEAANGFADFDRRARELGKTDAVPLSVSAGYVMRGFFYLDVVARGVKVGGKKDEDFAERAELPYPDLLYLVRRSFSLGMGRLVRQSLLQTGLSPDKAIFAKLLSCPFFEEEGAGSGRRCEVTSLERNLTPELWLRSVAFASYWNLVASQRLHGQWEGSFDAAEELEALAKVLKLRGLDALPPQEGSGVVASPLAAPGKPIRIWPSTVPDVVASSSLVRALGMMRQNDPLDILRYANETVKVARSPEIMALGFLLAGTAYYDLNEFALAKRVFSWCEGISREFSTKAPACLLLGAESAFRESRFDVAKAGFSRFLSLSGDGKYGPWAMFRLALISQKRGDVSEARDRYAEMTRLFPAHAVAKDAEVRDFCIQVVQDGLETETRKKWAARLEPELPKLRNDLRLQARTCLLWAGLLTVTEESGESRGSVAADAARQLDLFLSYKREFPESPFLPLFEERMAKLNLAQVLQLLENNRCRELVEAYSRQGQELETLGSRGKRYLATLGWGPEERRFLLRCAALENRQPLWEQLRRTEAQKDGGKLQDLSFRFQKSRKARDAAALAESLSREAETTGWPDLVREAERAGDGYVREPHFWRGFAARAVLQFDLAAKSGVGDSFRRMALKGLLANPETAVTSPVACVWVVAEAETLDKKLWDKISATRTSGEWLDGMAGKEVKGTGACFKPLAATLLHVSRQRPTPLRDERVLRPYLESKGMKEAPEEWLSFAQRLQARLGRSHKEVRSIYENLAREAPSPALRNLARTWLEAGRGP